MKKTISIILLILLGTLSSLHAQDAHRTAATKVGDALNQLPAANEALFSRLMEDLLSTGQEGVLMLAQRLRSDGTSLPQAEYALDGMVQYVTRPGVEDGIRTEVAHHYAKALEQTEDPLIKAFFIRQLQLLGSPESLNDLAPYMFSEDLGGTAIRAITAIGGPAAVDLLLSAPLRAETITGLGRLGSPLAEKLLMSLAQTGNKEQLPLVWQALSRCGTMAAFDVMANAPAYDFLHYLERVATADPKKATRALRSLIKPGNDSQVRCFALSLLLDLQQEKEMRSVLRALNDADRSYRRTALEGTRTFLSPVVNSAVMKKMKRLSAPALADVIDWLGTQRNPALIPYIADPWLAHEDLEVASASARAILNTPGEHSPQILAGMLISPDSLRTDLALECLLASGGDVVQSVLNVYPHTSTAGKTAALALLGARKSRANEPLVLEALKDPDPEVRLAAARGLSGVVRPENRETYFRLLENSPEELTEPLQQAVLASLFGYGAEEQYDILMARMQQAGAGSQSLYYAPLAGTGTKRAVDFLSDRYLEEGNIQDYIALINQWNPAGAQKVIFLRKALERVDRPEDIVALLGQMRNTGAFQAMVASAPYLESGHKDIALTAAMNIYRLAVNHKEFHGQQVTAWMEKVLQILEKADYTDSIYDIQNVKKYLAELPEDRGFEQIFNEKDLEGWQGLVGNPVSRNKMDPKELARAQEEADKVAFSQWVVEDGKLLFLGKGDNLCTKKAYGDFEMYVDWLLYPEGPEADAGIYLRGSPQVQIWDTARVHVGAQVGSGGLYNNAKNPSAPTHVADNRLGEWNSFFIRMEGERVTVFLNGELVVDNVIMENYWDRSQPIFPYGAIELQAHGSKVAYRDIYVRELERPQPFTLSAEEEAEGFQILFDGTTLHQWTGNTTDYFTRDGVLEVRPTDQGFGDLYTVKEYDDFIFRFEFKLTPGANNGVGIRTPGTGDAAYEGMEIQILDHYDPIYQPWLLDHQYHGSVYGVIPAHNRDALRPVGEWNQEEIYVKGTYIRVTLNGEVITEGDISAGPIDGREHPGLERKGGKIGFLGHGSRLWFRNIRIKEL